MASWNIHDYLLPMWGTPVGELFDLEPLSQMCENLGRYSFFVTSAPLNVKGGIACMSLVCLKIPLATFMPLPTFPSSLGKTADYSAAELFSYILGSQCNGYFFRCGFEYVVRKCCSNCDLNHLRRNVLFRYIELCSSKDRNDIEYYLLMTRFIDMGDLDPWISMFKLQSGFKKKYSRFLLLFMTSSLSSVCRPF